jgi:hypothetical protein
MSVGNSSNAAFYNISNGKICRQFKSPTANSKERVNMNGKTVHEEHYDYIDGIITDIQTRDSEYGKSWNITLEDEGQSQVLQMPYSSGYSNSFLKTLPNVDLTQKVKLIPKLTIENEKKKTTLFVNQRGVAIKWAFTKDNPGDMPQLKKIKVKGKEVYDDSEIMEFLENMVVNEIVPKLKKAKAPVETEPEEVLEDDEKLPF